MAKIPQTAIERNAKSSALKDGSKRLTRALPSKVYLHTKKWKRIRNLLLFFLALELFLFSLCFRVRNSAFIPAETFHNLAVMITLPFRLLLDNTGSTTIDTSQLPYFGETLARFRLSLIAFLSGVIICVGGTMFQTIFKNPIASPNMLGAATGVSFGNVLFVLTYGISAESYLHARYAYCYTAAAVLVVIAYFAGKFSGRRLDGFSVEATIIAGMMITHLGGVFLQWFNIKLMEDETGLQEIYRSLTSGDRIFYDSSSMRIFLIICAITIIPMILIRFRFNAVAFEDMEVRAMGINNEKLRAVGLILGSLMATAALIHCGDVGFLCMVIPFMCRERLQTEFGEVAYLSAMAGGMVSLAVRIVITMINSTGFYVPASAITTLLMLPLLVITIIRRGSVFQ